MFVAAAIAGHEEHGDSVEVLDMLLEVDLLPALVVQEEAVAVGGDVGRGGDGNVGGVHVGHHAPAGGRPQ